MKTFTQYVVSEEASYRRKGWLNTNTGKMVLWAFRGRSIRPFHDEYLVNNLNKFVRNPDEILRRFAELNGFEPEDDETQDMWRDIKSGKVDRDSNLDGIMNSLGWFRVVFDEGICSLETNNAAQARKGAEIILRKMDWDKQVGWLGIYERGSLDDPKEINSRSDLEAYVKTGRVPKRTKIGATMAMFRGESVLHEAKMRGLYFKGWMTPRGRVVIHSTTATGTSKYHIQILTDLFSFEKMRPHMGEWVGAEHLKFLQRMKKDKIADFTDDQVKELIEKQYKAIYNQWATGKIDQDRGVEEKFQKMGWVKIWVDRNEYGMSMIQGNDKRKVLECAKKLDKKFGGWDGFMTKSMSISTKNDIGARIGTAIRDSAGWDHYLRTGEVRRHQTEIGRKMAMFREKKEYQWLLPDYPEQIRSDEDEGGWAMGDTPVPIKWTGDHKQVYKQVMKHRKRNNPKYHEPKMTEEMKPTDHVKKKGDKYVVLNKDGEMMKSFDDEASANAYANKNHDKLMEAWSNKYKRSIDCANPKGFSQRAHCAGRKKKTYEDVGGVKYGFSDYFTLQVRP